MIIKNQNLSEQIYEDLRNDILKNKLAFGAKISVDEIAQRYEVSHTPAREALNKLAKDGLIISSPNKVHKIFKISKKVLLEVMEIRKMYECYSIDKAIKNVRQEKFEILYRKVLNLKTSTEKNVCHTFYSSDIEFHKTIIEGTMNSRLIEMYNQIFFIIRSVIYRIDHKQDDINNFILEHIDLLSLILEKDIRKAKELLKNHLDHSKNYYLENFM
jgi:DNA-binding GntR family transcriptional regulator